MAEIIKKAKAPAKPRTASATPRKPANKKAAPGAQSTVVQMHRPSHHEIASLAERYWAERGRTDGQAEQDWLRAEQELMKLAS